MKTLAIMINYNCNNNCIFCANRRLRQHKASSLEEIKRRIKFFSGIRGKTGLIFSGGEPLISPKFFKLFHSIQGEKLQRICVQSNGRMLCYESLVKKLKKIAHSKLYFFISFHFPNSRLYRKYCQADGFQQTMKGIRNIVKNNCDIITNTLIMKPNLAYLKDIIKMLKKEGVKEMQLKFIDGKWLKNGYREYVPKYSECVPIIREIIEQNRDIKIWANEVPPCVLGEKYKKNIVSCVDRERFLFDSKREVKPMEEILSHRLVLPNCKGCIYKYLCGGVRKEYVQTYGIKEFNPIIKTSLSEIE